MGSHDVRAAYNAAVESIRDAEFPMLKGKIIDILPGPLAM